MSLVLGCIGGFVVGVGVAYHNVYVVIVGQTMIYFSGLMQGENNIKNGMYKK